MRPHTPSLRVAHAADVPTSPPETPTTASPTFNRKEGASGRALYSKAHLQDQQPNITPIGGNSFSYSRGPRHEEISPRSSNSSGDDGSDESTSPPQSIVSDGPVECARIGSQFSPIAKTIIQIDEACFQVEELSDVDSEDDIHLHILPTGFEDAESDRSRSRSRPSREVDPVVMTGFKNLDPFEDSDDLDHDEEFDRTLRQQRQEKRIRRMKSGSISKRTVSERGSDSDREDVLPYYEGNENGPNFRRVRRKGENRTSIQFTGPLPDTILELKEEDGTSSDWEAMASELPFWTLMETDSD
ncbi:hypothetical protein F5Y15DRAFT_111760 [Xylariaceae sp. FL0016]|nr:hypothetical protein F5Y15DRAFT_111760 [Xylariaceae sp. FL0016]